MRPLAAVLVLALAAPAAAEAPTLPTTWKEVPKKSLRPFTPAEPRRVVLGNGLVIFLLEDHELPLVRGTARVAGGSREEPAAKVGLVDVYGDAWRTGGTRTRSGDELDDFLEARAAKVESWSTLDASGLSFDCLKSRLDEVFPVFVEILKEPQFREDKVELAKAQMATVISRRNDEPDEIADREIRKLGYGAASPYARHPEYATVGAVTRQDLLDWHQRTVHPNNLILGLVGDFDSTAMEARLRRAFASWAKGPAFTRARAAVSDPAPGLYFVAKDDVNQTNVRMAHLGTTRNDPDYFAVEVMNEILGGGMSARLFSHVRTQKGLAYAVGGGVGANYDYPGLFTLMVGTKSETTAAAIDALLAEVEGMVKDPGSAEELQRAKDAILNSFVFRFDSREKVLRERMLYEFYGYPPDFASRYRAAIEKVTAADVARVAQKFLHRDKLAILVVGRAQDFDRPLSSYGEVKTLDVTIPEPPQP